MPEIIALLTPYAGRGRPRIYGERFNPRQIDAKYCVSTDTIGHLRTEVYQLKLRHKKFADLLNVVCILKTNLTTKQQSHVLLFSSDLALDAVKMIDYYALRFQSSSTSVMRNNIGDYKIL